MAKSLTPRPKLTLEPLEDRLVTAVDAFIFFSPIQGDAPSHGHNKSFEIKDFSFGVSNPSQVGTSPGGTSKSSVSLPKLDLDSSNVIKPIDPKAIVSLFQGVGLTISNGQNATNGGNAPHQNLIGSGSAGTHGILIGLDEINGAGGNYLPRVGMEIIVNFMEGDPDRPLILGKVYEFSSMPPIN